MFTCDNVSSQQQAQYPCDEADDENWSRVVLTQRQASVLCVAADGSGCGNSGSGDGNVHLYSTWAYAYVLTDVSKLECPDCTVDMYWGDQNDGDYLDYYDTQFMGFSTTNVTNPDNSVTEEKFYSTTGYGVATSSISCKSPRRCYVAPWANPSSGDVTNPLHGRIAVQWDYATDGSTILKETMYQYAVTCPPNGDPSSVYNTDPSNQYLGMLTSELDPNNPLIVCEIEPSQTDVYVRDGGSNADANQTTITYSYTYDGHGHMSQSTKTTIGNNTGIRILDRIQYVWDDDISTTKTSASGAYFNDIPAIKTTEDGAGGIKACTYEAYDGGISGATGQQSSLVKGLLTREDQYSSSCTPGSLSGQVSTATAYDTSGAMLATEDADALAGISGHTDAADCTINSVAYSACAQFDSYYDALPTQVTNALGQKTQLNYTTDGSNTNSPDATNGWGTWLTTSTDANGNITSYGYDVLGRLTATVQPGFGDTLTNPTVSYNYQMNCKPTGAREPCTALLTTKRLGGGGSSAPTVTSATYYDGWGRPVETVTPISLTGNVCAFSVQYTLYDGSGRVSFKSDPYIKTLSLGNCTPAWLDPDTSQPGTTTTYDGLGRVLTSKDALSHTTTTSYSETQPQGANVNDSAWYEATTVVDANNHQTISLADGFGHTRYTESFTGA
ncbi:MAG TPA: hypothetical protein VKQ36_07670, partial [Ktedonobacterales bacterium]|nr:hypothetical protein [Ktedonobacterales bacterium]